MMTYSDYLKGKWDYGTMMCYVRKRERKGNHYRYKIIDPLGDCWWWEDERKKEDEQGASR
jgi:hypothetical protein